MNSPQYKPPSPKLCRLSVVECQSFLKIFFLMSGVELEKYESFGGRGDDQTRTYKNKFRSLHKPEKIEHKTWNLSKSWGLEYLQNARIYGDCEPSIGKQLQTSFCEAGQTV
jgi:hypothetical protein